MFEFIDQGFIDLTDMAQLVKNDVAVGHQFEGEHHRTPKWRAPYFLGSAAEGLALPMTFHPSDFGEISFWGGAVFRERKGVLGKGTYGKKKE